MPRKKHLINVHTSTGTTAPTGASLYLGEIAVQHTPNDPALWIKVGTANTSTEYEKFIGLTEIVSLIENAELVLGSGYTYSGIPYVNSATSIADAYSALTYELIEDEETIADSMNDLNGRINTLTANTTEISGAVMSLSAAIGDIHVDMILGSGYTYSGISYVNSATSLADAYSAATDILIKLSGTVEDDEYAIAAAFNDVNDRIDELSGNSFNPAPLSASVVNNLQNITALSASTTGLSDGLDTLSGATTGLSGAVVAISAAMADIKVDMVLGSGYTYSAIPYVNSATLIADAYSALTNEFIKTERTAAEAVNDLNDRIIELSGDTTTHTATTITNGTSSQMHLPTVTSSDNGKILMVSGGIWTLTTPVSIYQGGSEPAQNLGNDGDIYLEI